MSDAKRCIAEATEWIDGLPAIEPTEEMIAEVLEQVSESPDTVIDKIPPSYREVRVRDIARAMVAAGAQPVHAGVILAALRACLNPAFNLLAVQTTTEPATPLIVVNGPLARTLGVNSGANLFGQGWRANATIGRSLRFLLVGLGGAVPGTTDMATFGHPGKYTYCIAEAEEGSPWPPLHVDLGHRGSQNAVTVFAADSPQDVIDVESSRGEDLLWSIARALAVPASHNAIAGGQVLVILSPGHAAIAARAGWSKHQAREFLFRQATIRLDEFSAPMAARVRHGRRTAASEDIVRPVDGPGDILLMVGGGVGGHTAIVRTFGASRAVTEVVA